MSGKKYVPEDVYLVCDKGVKPSQLKTLSYTETWLYGEKMCTKVDKVLIVNFEPFGACAAANGSPCTAPVTDWTNVTDKITVGGNELLLENSELPCTLGGNIKIFFSLADAMAALPQEEKSFWEKLNDFGQKIEDFKWGVAKGLWKGLKGTVTGIADLVVWAGKHHAIYQMVNPEGYKEQLQKDKETLKSLGNLAKKGGTWVYRNSMINMITDPGDYMAAQTENKKALDAMAEAAANMSAEEWGELVGQIGFEVLLEVATAGGAAALTALKVADKTVDVARVVNKLDKLDDLGDTAKVLDKIEDGTPLPKAPDELGDVVYNKGKTPEDFGVKMIADNPELLKLWNDNLRALVKADTKGGDLFRKYLDNLENGVPMSNDELGEVWDVVRSRFKNQAKKNGVDLPSGDPIHHWNYNKADYPELITNPSNLTEPIPYDLHKEIHQATQSGKTWSSPIKPEHEIPINSSPL